MSATSCSLRLVKNDRRRRRGHWPAVGPPLHRRYRIHVQYRRAPSGVAARAPRRARTLRLSMGIARIDEHANHGRRRDQFVHQLQPLRPQLRAEIAEPGDVAARLIEAGDKAHHDRITIAHEDDRNRRRRRPCRLATDPRRRPDMTATFSRTRSSASAGNRSIDRPRNGIRSPSYGPQCSRFDSTLGGTQQTIRPRSVRRAVEDSNHWHRRLLRARRERPRRRRAAEQRDELAALHSITSSARASSIGGTSRPRAFAVLRLMTSSYLVGACTGRSAGFSPLRMRST